MAKYLIEDIIPPEKKHRGGTHKKSAHHEYHEGEHAVNVRRVDHSLHHLQETESEPVRHSASSQKEISSRIQHNDPRDILISEIGHQNHVESQIKVTQPEEKHSAPVANPLEKEGASTHLNSPLFPVYGAYRDNNTDKKKTSWLPWIIGTGIIAIIIVFSLNFFFNNATIIILPKHETIPLDASLTAYKNPIENKLPYAVIKIEATESGEVPATGTKTVTEKASGQIVVYNEQAVAQRLIKNTRFQSSSRKIYRINESVLIPKATTIAGKVAPGSITVTVYADEAGPEYNSEPTDFTVPGLKNLPQYTKVYARSKGSITGGASGTMQVVSDSDMKQASDVIRVRLETKLRGKAHADLLPSQISYDQGIVVEFGAPELSKTPASSDEKATIVQKGTLSLVVFDRMALTKEIAKTLIPTYANEDISIKNIESLAYSMPVKNSAELDKDQTITFTLSGSPELEWIVDAEKIKDGVKNLPKQGFNELLRTYATVERAKATLRPFWKKTFPSDPDKIIIEIVDKMPE